MSREAIVKSTDIAKASHDTSKPAAVKPEELSKIKAKLDHAGLIGPETYKEDITGNRSKQRCYWGVVCDLSMRYMRGL